MAAQDGPDAGQGRAAQDRGVELHQQGRRHRPGQDQGGDGGDGAVGPHARSYSGSTIRGLPRSKIKEAAPREPHGEVETR